MFKPKDTLLFPESDRFQFPRLMKSIERLALAWNDHRLAAAARECLTRLTVGHGNCPLARLFVDDYENTRLSPRLAFLRSEELCADNSANGRELLDCLLSRVKEQASACNDSKYLQSVLACESFIKTGDHRCPFHRVDASPCQNQPGEPTTR